MASAEQLLNEAQYAFQNIGVSDTRDNRKHAARAKSISRKIIRKYAGTSEAAIAHTMLLHLDEKANVYAEKFAREHDHGTAAENRHSHASVRTPVPGQSVSQRTVSADSEQLHWVKFIDRIFSLPKAVLGAVFLAGTFFFALLGPFILLPIVVLILLGSPLRQILPVEKRHSANDVVRKINAWLAEQEKQ